MHADHACGSNGQLVTYSGARLSAGGGPRRCWAVLEPSARILPDRRMQLYAGAQLAAAAKAKAFMHGSVACRHVPLHKTKKTTKRNRAYVYRWRSRTDHRGTAQHALGAGHAGARTHGFTRVHACGSG